MFDFQTSSEASFEDGPWCLSSKSSRTIHFVESLTGSGKEVTSRRKQKQSKSFRSRESTFAPGAFYTIFYIYFIYSTLFSRCIWYILYYFYIYSIYSILFPIYIFPTFVYRQCLYYFLQIISFQRFIGYLDRPDHTRPR